MRRRPTLPTSAALAEAAAWAAGVLVIVAGWAAGRGVAVGMDTAHCAAAGFAVSGSIFLAVAMRGDRAAPARRPSR